MQPADIIVEVLRAAVRPVLAISTWGATIFFMAKGTTIPDAWWALVGTITTFYFVQRAAEKAAGRERRE